MLIIILQNIITETELHFEQGRRIVHRSGMYALGIQVKKTKTNFYETWKILEVCISLKCIS